MRMMYFENLYVDTKELVTPKCVVFKCGRLLFWERPSVERSGSESEKVTKDEVTVEMNKRERELLIKWDGNYILGFLSSIGLENCYNCSVAKWKENNEY